MLSSQNSGSYFGMNIVGDASVFGVNQLPDVFGIVKAKLQQAVTYTGLFTDVFGDKSNMVEFQTVIKQWAIGDFSQLPNIQVIPAANMNGSNGGYDKITNSIYLSTDLFSSKTSPIDSRLGAAGVLTEEIGHFLDRFGEDTRGDEGEIFKNSVFGYVPTAAESNYIHQEDDRAFINVGDQLVQVEVNVLVASTIESLGNTKLVADAAGLLYTQVGASTPIAIKIGGQQIYQNIYPGWQTLAVETVNGQNQVLWKNTTGNYLHVWKLDANWNWLSSEGQWALNSVDALTQETNFQFDANADGVIGSPYSTVEANGNTKLVKDVTNKYFAQAGSNTPIAIKIGGQQIYQDIYPGWQTLAVETVNGQNQVLWKNTTGNYLHVWKLDANWNWLSSEGQWALNSADALTQETNFQFDANGDGVIGSTVEANGNTKLVKDATNKYFAQAGNNTPISIKNGGQQIYQDIYPGWQPLAVETVNGQNQVLWKNTTGNYLHLWRLDANWNWLSSEGQWALNSADALTQETNFQFDANGDGVIGSAYSTLEANGNTKLVKDATNKYFAQAGNNTPITIKIGGQQIYQDIYPGWQPLAVETVNGQNQVLWKNTTGNYLHLWKLDANWNWLSSEGQWALNSADALTQETNFQFDANGDGVIGLVTSITVTSPNGGNSLQRGQAVTIQWNDNIPDNVRVDLYKNNIFYRNITTSTPSNGSLSWTVPTDVLLGTDYKIRIAKPDNTLIDFSDNNFSITGTPNIDLKGYSLVSPVTAAAGSTQNINYNVQNAGVDPSGAFRVGFYLSTDTIFTTGDRLLGSETINSLAGGGLNGNLSKSLTLPAVGDSFYTGDKTYYIGMIVDDLNVAAETNEGNNSGQRVGDDYAAVTVNGTVAPFANHLGLITDFDKDGKTDIFWRKPQDGTNIVRLMNGGSSIGDLTIESVPDAALYPVALADFNNDGNVDILWRYHWSQNTGANQIWLMNGSQRINTIILDSEPNNDWEVVGTGDFNSDGYVDILWRNTNPQEPLIAVWLLNSQYQRTPVLISVPPQDNPGVDWSIKGTGDFNGDGKIDILWRNSNNGEIAVWFMDGLNRSSVSLLTQKESSSVWDIVGTGDFNGDGKIDIQWRTSTTGENAAWLMNGTTYIGALSLGVVPTDWTTIGYKKPDLIIQNPVAPSLINVGDSFTISAVTKNIGKAVAVPSDVRYWLSNDNLLDKNSDIPLGQSGVNWLATGNITPTLDGSSQSNSFQVTYNPTWGTGNKFILFEADSSNTVFNESNEGNNIFSQPITIAPSPLIWENPLPPNSYTVEQEFGNAGHTGIDLGSDTGTRIEAAKSGTVTFVGTDKYGGNYIDIDHGGGLKTRYLHLSTFAVSVGNVVTDDTKIGEVGNTGLSTGPHLHFEVWQDGVRQNPRNYISF